jgi:RNA polymerase sigma-70 factor, ECF subfamily
MRRQELDAQLDNRADTEDQNTMSAGMATMSDTRLSILLRVRDLGDAEGWREFHAIYRPLILGYLRSLGLEEPDAHDLTQEVFCRLMAILPTFELDRGRGRFRTYLWKLTYTTLVDWVRRKKVRGRAEAKWVPGIRRADESERSRLEGLFLRQHRERILEVVLPRARAKVSATAWACFEQRLLRGRPAAEVAAERGVSANVVYVYASRVMKEVRRLCAELDEDQSHEPDPDLS